MIAPRRHETGESALQDHRGVVRYCIRNWSLGDTLSSPRRRTGPPEGKNFTADFRLETERSPARFTKSFLAKSFNLNALYRSRGSRRIRNARESSAYLRHASACTCRRTIKGTLRVYHEMWKKVSPWRFRPQFQA